MTYYTSSGLPYSNASFFPQETMGFKIISPPMMPFQGHSSYQIPQTHKNSEHLNFKMPSTNVTKNNSGTIPNFNTIQPIKDSKSLPPLLPEPQWDVPTLPSAAIFRPTEEEFKDPMKYIASIRTEGQKYGICKIIPPSEKWLKGKKMIDMVDPSSFLFPTKVQNIHQLQTRDGPCSKFMSDLESFLEKNKTPLRSKPVIEGQFLNLYKLYKSVNSRGGMFQVSIENKWKEIVREMKLNCENISLQQILRQQYEKYLLSYELHLKTLSTSNFYQLILGPQAKKMKETKDKQVSSKRNDSDSDEEFGYSDGKIYTMKKFRKMADQFKKKWFPGNATPEEIENMYWKIVESSEENVTVHYGSDVDVGIYGSGFPNAQEDLDKASGWNLNLFSTLPGSVLNFLNEQISGVTRPMMYIGMLFSTFCWHTEDNYLYSINYLHHGASKTWYGIPAIAAAQFEKVMRNTVPELFEQTPNLLFLLITMISPRILVANKVPIYRVVQREGEFMITFPKGYHAGFSHGFNCAESSNFALDDWFPYGRECLERYRSYSRSSVLSIDKILCTAASSSSGTKFIPRLSDELQIMRSREIFLREKTLIKGGTWKCAHFDSYTGEKDEIVECAVCKYDCYLSGIVCPCNPSVVVCLRHSDRICNCEPSRKYFLFRYKVSELNDMLFKLGVKEDELTKDPMCIPFKCFSGRGRASLKNSIKFQLKGISKPTIKRLARRAGMKKVIGINYEEKNSLLNEEMHVMETIADSRINNGKTEYLLKWEGLPLQESIWLEENELCCSAIIDAYKNKFRKRGDPLHKTRSFTRACRSKRMAGVLVW